MKFIDYNKAKDLNKDFTVTRKLDGVRVHYVDGVPKSRAGKDLYNLPVMPDGVYEVFLGDFKTTISAVRTHEGSLIDKKHLYSLSPYVDTRLYMMMVRLPEDLERLTQAFDKEITLGGEGFVLHPIGPGPLVKMKAVYTFDVTVTDVLPGKGRNEGRVGSLVTPMGNVGTGLKDEDRERTDWVGKIIEVQCMSVSPANKFRHPRYIRTREDK